MSLKRPFTYPLPEVIAGYLYPLLAVLSLFFYSNFSYEALISHTSGFLFFFFDPSLILLLGAFSLYLLHYVYRFLFQHTCRFLLGEPVDNIFSLSNALYLITSICFVGGGILLSHGANIILYLFLTRVNVQQVALSSSMLMEADRMLFKVHPPLVIHRYIPEWLSSASLWSYSHLGDVMGIFFILLILTNAKLFRVLSLSTVAVILIAYPVWLLVPAVSPEEMYRQNILNLNEFSPLIKKELLNLTLSPALKEYLNALSGIWSKPEKGQYAVTAFPSMHMAWVLVLLWTGFKLWKPLGIALVPFFILNLLGTLVTLQHYFVDLPLGILVGMIAVRISERMVNRFKYDRFSHYFIYRIQKSLEPISNLAKKRMPVRF